jgi:hypothetical protein
MPGPRLPMRRIRDVLRLSAAGMSKRKIAASLGVSATAARDCLGRARRAGLTWPLPESLTDEALELRLYPPPTGPAKDRRPQPDWTAIHRELRRPGVTLRLLWEEYRAVHPAGYGYSRYVASSFMLPLTGVSQGLRQFPWLAPQHMNATFRATGPSGMPSKTAESVAEAAASGC